MPKAIKEKLSKAADKLGLTDDKKKAYVYGTMNKKFGHKDYRTGGLFYKRGGYSKKELEEFFPKRKQKARRKKYKKKADRLLAELSYTTS